MRILDKAGRQSEKLETQMVCFEKLRTSLLQNAGKRREYKIPSIKLPCANSRHLSFCKVQCRFEYNLFLYVIFRTMWFGSRRGTLHLMVRQE